MLPDGFRWAPHYQYDAGDNGLFIAGELVAYLDARTDAGWLARLDVHLGGDLVTRRCTDWQRGRIRNCRRIPPTNCVAVGLSA